MSNPGAYLDHLAGPLLDPRVRDAIAAALAHAGSPSAVHEAARMPAALLEESRAAVAALIGAADSDEVILTAGATESRNLAVKGLAGANRSLGSRIVVTAGEHPATLAAAATAGGGDVVVAGIDGDGRVDARALGEAAAGEDVAVVCVHHGQEETGVLQDVPALVAAVRAARPDARIVVDAAATVGRVPLDVGGLGADAVVIGGPSLGAPAWTGALWVRPGARILPLIEGGLQEGGKRAGAEAVPAIAGLGEAARIAAAEGPAAAERMTSLAERLIERLAAVPDLRRNGPLRPRVPGHVQVSVAGVAAETLAVALGARGVAVSPGSTCTAIAGRPSPALEAMGLDARWTRSAILMTLGPGTSAGEVDLAAAVLGEEAARLRALVPVGA